VYAAALDKGYTPASVVVDAPISFRDNGRWWTPHNYEDRYFGPTRLREALTFSRNVVTVKVASKIGTKYLTSYIPQFGIRSRLARNLSLALGTSEVTPLELARAYGVFATGGNLFEPLFITKITDGQGGVLEEFTLKPKQVISPETAYLVTSMLKSAVERGTGRGARALGRPVAGKTGTSNDFQDTWFMGYTPELLTGVWVGFDEKRPLGDKETGGRVATPIWVEFMQAALGNRPVTDFALPEGISFVNINPRTGLRAVPGGSAMLECFRRGTEPPGVTVVAAVPPPPENSAASENTVQVVPSSSSAVVHSADDGF
jgi:penicillin-binding protein 1A